MRRTPPPQSGHVASLVRRRHQPKTCRLPGHMRGPRAPKLPMTGRDRIIGYRGLGHNGATGDRRTEDNRGLFRRTVLPRTLTRPGVLQVRAVPTRFHTAKATPFRYWSRVGWPRFASALPCPAGRSVPGRGGPERRRRPRPDGTGTPRLLTACSRDRPTPAEIARDSYPWGEAKAQVERPARHQTDTSDRRSNDS